MSNNIRSAVSSPHWNHVSAAILNGGAIRTSVDEQSRNGEEEEDDGEEVEGRGKEKDGVEGQGEKEEETENQVK